MCVYVSIAYSKMLGACVTSTLLVLTIAIGVTSIMISDTLVTKSPLVFSKWPPYPNGKSSSLRHQIFQHLRTSGRIPPNMIVKRYPSPMPSYTMMRPMKYAQLKKVPLSAPSYYRPTISTPPRYRFQSSPAAPNSGEYVFENPFNNPGYHAQQNKKKQIVSLTDDTKYNPIHTVAAPNLNKNIVYTTQSEFIAKPNENQIYEQKDPQFNQITFRPLSVPQYQVTEQINDNTVRVDPFTGKPKQLGPDSSQSIPAYKISHAFDSINSFNQGDGIASRPLPIEISFIPQQQPIQSQASSAPVVAPLIQLANQVPQQQLPDTYVLPIGNQPQLQQHLLQQQSMIQNVPVSVYNPTYLVTQSNNLLKQHREQLFKPSPGYVDTLNQSPTDLSSGNTVASAGQLLSSIQSQNNEIHQSHLHDHSNSFPIRPEFSSSISGDNGPSFQRYVAERPSNSGIVVQQQPVLTESELNNLLNIGNQGNDDQNRFVASTYYQSQPDPEVEIENRQRQQFNDIKIAKANEELKEQINSAEITTTLTPNTHKKTAHQQHQEKLAEQFAGKTTLRIYVPDEEYQKKNDVRRSDLVRVEPKNEYQIRRDDYQRKNYQHLQKKNDEVDTTTDDSDNDDDYLAHDTESVDRLALDGETRELINSSTIDSYNY